MKNSKTILSLDFFASFFHQGKNEEIFSLENEEIFSLENDEIFSSRKK